MLGTAVTRRATLAPLLALLLVGVSKPNTSPISGPPSNAKGARPFELAHSWKFSDAGLSGRGNVTETIRLPQVPPAFAGRFQGLEVTMVGSARSGAHLRQNSLNCDMQHTYTYGVHVGGVVQFHGNPMVTLPPGETSQSQFTLYTCTSEFLTDIGTGYAKHYFVAASDLQDLLTREMDVDVGLNNINYYPGGGAATTTGHWWRMSGEVSIHYVFN